MLSQESMLPLSCFYDSRKHVQAQVLSIVLSKQAHLSTTSLQVPLVTLSSRKT